jgi:hypothetical protein
MAVDDYDATELVETYGLSVCCLTKIEYNRLKIRSNRLPHEVHYHWCAVVRSFQVLPILIIVEIRRSGDRQIVSVTPFHSQLLYAISQYVVPTDSEY